MTLIVEVPYCEWLLGGKICPAPFDQWLRAFPELWRETLQQKRRALKHVTIYTDGGCIGNPGPGGYGVVLLYGGHRKELSGGYRLTTNNRMELTAAIVGLGALRTPCDVTLHSDSEYLVTSMRAGLPEKWKANGWRRGKKRGRALNTDLWDQVLTLCATHHVKFEWVRGHSGDVENERCDQLSQAAARRSRLPTDLGYEGQGVERISI